jgi:hypothetical protein
MDRLDASVPVARLAELQAHLDKLVREPDTSLDGQLFDDVELQIFGKLILVALELTSQKPTRPCCLN